MIKILYLYARKDKSLFQRLLKHLSLLRREMRISEWSDDEILPGMDRAREIDRQLSTADVIPILLSANFLNSEDCCHQMYQARDRLHTGNVHVIPVILSPVNWKETPVGNLQALPTEGRPVTQWRDREAAFQEPNQR
jgi:TIR domain-containing protein